MLESNLVDLKEGAWGVDLRYQYDAEGGPYQKRYQSGGSNTPGSKKRAQELVACNPVGARVLVHVDPASPAKAALALEEPVHWLFLFAGVVFIIAAALWPS